ncbi:60S ribosomal protein L31 [Gonapodya sp. JEL0774]|nr:60S ribosomal protein L31 [Gonapodya sp. JEL0774]
MAKEKKSTKKSVKEQVVSRDYTIHLHKHVFGRTFKTRAPKAIKVIREFAQKTMGTKDVRLDPGLNKAVWEGGIKSVPTRIRVRLSRKKNDAEDATEKLYTYVEHVIVPTFKGLSTTAAEATA